MKKRLLGLQTTVGFIGRALAKPDRSGVGMPISMPNSFTPAAGKRLQKNIPWAFARRVALPLLAVACLSVNCRLIGQEPTDASLQPTRIVTQEVVGSRLLSPVSYGFEIPAQPVIPTEIENVVTMDDEGNEIVCSVYAQVGPNFIVMLPDGQLVDRMADVVTQTDSKFVPAKTREIATQLLHGRLRNFRDIKVDRSRNYVFAYNTSVEFKDVTKKILESMLDGVRRNVESHGLQTHAPQLPMVVVMFNTAAEFRAYSEGTMVPAGAVAYYNMVNNHIVLHAESPFADRPDLARGQLLSTIAHEGAHQILHNIGVQQRLSMWPMWLSEGIAEYLAPTSFGKSNRWKGAGVVNDLRMFELESYLQTKNIVGFDGSTIEKAITARQLDSTGYAIAWAITHFLANEHKKEFGEYLKVVKELGPLRGMASRDDRIIENLEHFKLFFSNDTKEFETEMIKYLAQLRYKSPVSDYRHYVGLAVYENGSGKKRNACFFHTEEKVNQWIKNVAGHLNREQRATLQTKIERFPDRQKANNKIRRFLK